MLTYRCELKENLLERVLHLFAALLTNTPGNRNDLISRRRVVVARMERGIRGVDERVAVEIGQVRLEYVAVVGERRQVGRLQPEL